MKLPPLPVGYFWLHILEWDTVIEDTQQIRPALKQSTEFFTKSKVLGKFMVKSFLGG